jgi:aspartyl-tRNA(Asn)/glutamyl-tRNA(Gln) amidotransferase subunit C
LKLSNEEVKHIAKLSRLALSEEEAGEYASQLSQIIEFVEQLNSLDTSSVEPTSHVMQISNVMVEDIPGASLSREEALRNAPDSDGRFYRVPKIIE